MGGITVQTLDAITEVVIVGEVNGTAIIVLGTNGKEEAWEAAKSLLEVFAENGVESDAWVIDVDKASVRPVNLWVIDEDGDDSAS